MRIGIDLGGTKIEGVLLDSGGRMLCRERIPTPQNDYEATVRAIVSLVRFLELTPTPPPPESQPPDSPAPSHPRPRPSEALPTVGIGTPGAISPLTGRMKNCNSTWLNGRPLREDLARELGRPVRLANDANCFALSEAVDGAAAGAEVVFGVILGTGVGGGVVVRGRPLLGPNAIAGEWGHNALPAMFPEEQPGRSCYCGRSGCIETFLSGPGLAADYEQATAGAPASAERLASEEIVARAEAGDVRCEQALLRYESRLARALGSVINVLDPDVVVLGGGLSRLERLYSNVPRQWGRWVFSDSVATRLVAPMHGDSSGVRGAAWLWAEGDA